MYYGHLSHPPSLFVMGNSTTHEFNNGPVPSLTAPTQDVHTEDISSAGMVGVPVTLSQEWPLMHNLSTTHYFLPWNTSTGSRFPDAISLSGDSSIIDTQSPDISPMTPGQDKVAENPDSPFDTYATATNYPMLDEKPADFTDKRLPESMDYIPDYTTSKPTQLTSDPDLHTTITDPNKQSKSQLLITGGNTNHQQQHSNDRKNSISSSYSGILQYSTYDRADDTCCPYRSNEVATMLSVLETWSREQLINKVLQLQQERQLYSDQLVAYSAAHTVAPAGHDETRFCRWAGCRFQANTLPKLIMHIRAVHVGSGKGAYYCEWADCPRQNKPFMKRHKMHNHLRTHTGEKPFGCQFHSCGKRFSRLDSLNTHVKTHSSVRPFACSVQGCTKAYFHARSLRKHMKTHTLSNNRRNP